MPFTPAHVAAVLPLRGRLGLPFAALAAGSMSPDLPYFLPFSMPRLATHTALGIISWDLMFGLAMWGAWRLATPGLHDMAPSFLRSRWRPAEALPSPWWAVVLAVMIGAATHVVWDSFTHAGYPGAALPPLAVNYPSPIGPFPGYRYLQYASGAIGLSLVLLVGARQPFHLPAPRRHPRLAALTPVLTVMGGVAFVAARFAAMEDPSELRSLAFRSVTAFISGAGLALVLLCLAHFIVERRSLERARVQGFR